jgi:hypothetical protein
LKYHSMYSPFAVPDTARKASARTDFYKSGRAA